MHFENPAWLLLLPALALLGWQWPALELQRPLRVLCVLLLALALADPRWQRMQPGVDLWVLMDRSASAGDLVAPRAAEWEGLLRRSMGPEDRLHFVDFAEDAVVRADEPGAISEINPASTRIATAIQLATLQKDKSRATRLLLLSDGYPTEPMGGAAELLARAQLPLDLRLAALEGGADYQVDSIHMPPRAQAGEPFVIDALVRADGAYTPTVPYEVKRDGVSVASGMVSLNNGIGRVRLTDRIADPGAVRYTVQLLPEKDPRPGNNTGETWIEAVASPRIVLVSSFPDDPVAATLRAQGIEVELVTAPRDLHQGRLSGARAVIINNISAGEIPEDFMGALAFFVEEQGGGLMMLGGRNSFGSGGYHGSKIDPLLPVSMELRQEHRKLSVAMAIVIDRSGSMRASVSDGMGGTRQKIELAGAGAAEAVRLLGARDSVAIFAVDSQAHEIVPLTSVGPNRDQIISMATGIHSQGGGIFVYQGLLAAWHELQKAGGGQKHIILFSDAADSEEPGDYVNLLAEVTAAGATVSVIGLGKDSDSDAAFIMDVAARGNGRMFFTSDASELPAIFTQDTAAVARSTFIDEPVQLVSTSGWAELAARPLEWPPAVDSYNVCYLRPKAAQAARSGDEYEAPLVAFWQHGAGRAAAVAFPMAGPFSETARAWPGYGDFATTLARWLMGGDAPPGLGLKARLDGDQLVLDLYFDSEWDNELAKNFPTAVLTQDGIDGRREVKWERLQPGHFQSRQRLAPGKPAVGAVRVGEHSLPFGPIAPGEDLEWRRDTAGPRALRALSAATGGMELTELSDAWRDTGFERFLTFRQWLLAALAVAVVLEAAATRVGVLVSWWREAARAGR